MVLLVPRLVGLCDQPNSILIVIAGSDPQSIFLRLVASDYGINEIADNFLPLVPGQISAMTVGVLRLVGLCDQPISFIDGFTS
jgi:hypothetical protein